MSSLCGSAGNVGRSARYTAKLATIAFSMQPEQLVFLNRHVCRRADEKLKRFSQLSSAFGPVSLSVFIPFDDS